MKLHSWHFGINLLVHIDIHFCGTETRFGEYSLPESKMP
jgi:hypothetical protein